MIAVPTRTAPRPYEFVIIASTLESAHGQEALMERIHRLSQERSAHQTRLARHPWSDREAAPRIRAIASELGACWAEARHERAARRVRLETALGVDPAVCEEPQRRQSHVSAHEDTHQQARKRHRISLPCAS